MEKEPRSLGSLNEEETGLMQKLETAFRGLQALAGDKAQAGFSWESSRKELLVEFSGKDPARTADDDEGILKELSSDAIAAALQKTDFVQIVNPELIPEGLERPLMALIEKVSARLESALGQTIEETAAFGGHLTPDAPEFSGWEKPVDPKRLGSNQGIDQVVLTWGDGLNMEYAHDADGEFVSGDESEDIAKAVAHWRTDGRPLIVQKPGELILITGETVHQSTFKQGGLSITVHFFPGKTQVN